MVWGAPARSESLPEVFAGCRAVPADWADGDSFPVVLPDGREFTVRLYGVDCIETAAANETLARRLRAQRRYFGIGGDNGADTGEAARHLGKQAAARAAELLGEPFTLETAFSDARGSGVSRRVYGFVTLKDGRDLAAVLVDEGWARAYGIARNRIDGTSAEEYRQHLADLELVAAASRRGIWAKTDWSKLAADRADERHEQHEIDALLGRVTPAQGIDPNTAPASLLETLPGIGPVLAERIVRERGIRRFESAGDLMRVKGISGRVLESLQPHLRFGAADAQKIGTPSGTGGTPSQRGSD